VAPPFLAWLDLPPRLRWLDVGCGTGALSAAVLAACAPSELSAVEPSAGFLQTARSHLAGQASLQTGSATEIPLADRSVDVVVSGLVLNFVPELPRALGEMIRVTRPGGTVAAYVWDYAGRMALIRHFWDEAVRLDPDAANLDEGVRFPLCRPDALMAAFEGAGLVQAAVQAIDVETRFASFDDYWLPFLGGQGPAPAYVASLDADRRAQLREALSVRLTAAADGSITLSARAWAVRGTVAHPAAPGGAGH